MSGKRYMAVAAAIVMQICLGGIYAWSAFVPSLQRVFGYTSAQTQLVFGSTIGCLTVAMLVAGRLQDRFGPRWLSMAGGLLVAAGYWIAGTLGNHFGWLWVGISLVNGMGVACGYISAIATGVRWFPERKGVISGLMVAGYGGGSILLTAIVQALLKEGWTALQIFRWVGCLYGPVIVVMASLLSVPPSAPGEAAVVRSSVVSLLRDRRFWPLAIGLGCGTFPGLIVIGNLKPMGLSFGLPEVAATLAISLFALGNILGRLAWGALQDQWGARRTALLSLALIALSPLLFLVHRSGLQAFGWASAFCGFCYGGSLALYVAQAAATYGSRNVGSVYPWALLAHGAAAIVGPFVGGGCVDLSGSFVSSLVLAFALGATGLIAYAWLAPRPS